MRLKQVFTSDGNKTLEFHAALPLEGTFPSAHAVARKSFFPADASTHPLLARTQVDVEGTYRLVGARNKQSEVALRVSKTAILDAPSLPSNVTSKLKLKAEAHADAHDLARTQALSAGAEVSSTIHGVTASQDLRLVAGVSAHSKVRSAARRTGRSGGLSLTSPTYVKYAEVRENSVSLRVEQRAGRTSITMSYDL